MNPYRHHTLAGILAALLLLWGATPGLVLAAGGGQALAELGGGQSGRARISAIAAKTQVSPGDQFAVAVVMEFEPHWHAWPNKPQAFEDFEPIATTIVVKDPPAWLERLAAIQWPKAIPTTVANPSGAPGTIQTPMFSGRSVAFVPLVVRAGAEPGPTTLKLVVGYQACDDTHCEAPEEVEIAIDLVVASPGTPPPSSADAATLAIFKDFDPTVFGRAEAVDFNVFGWGFSIDPSGVLGFALLLLVAAAGGLLLNFTPCVLPVIPIKILGLSASAGNPRRCLYLGTVMSLGVIAFWLVLGAAIATISGFTAISSLFQQSWFSIAVGVFIGLMGFGMLGLFTVSLPKAVYLINPSHETTLGSFVFGIMTAVLSTPCTAPLMGTAAAWATKQHPATTMTTFAAIGAGMAMPYFVLSANPKWVSRMPRTGPASELVKQVMGLLMLAVATFFLGTGTVSIFADPLRQPTRVYWWLIAIFASAAGAWLVFRTIRITPSLSRRVVFLFVGLCIAGGGVAAAAQFTRKGPIDWVYYSSEVFEKSRREGRVVVIDFTAEWCLNCKALEEAVLNRAEVARAIMAPGVTPLKVDLTGDNPAGRARLQAAGSVAIPFLAIYAPGAEEPVFTSDAYTPDQVLRALNQARERPSGTPSDAAHAR